MSLRPSQSAEYWTTGFALTTDDLEFLVSFMVERERPVSDHDLTKALIEYRLRREEQRIQRELARGKPYQPQLNFEIGDEVVFPLFDFALGKVVGKRPGKNPEHGDFDVIQVQIAGEPKPRSFAANLKTPHKLNQPISRDTLLEGANGPDVLIKQYGHEVRTRLGQELARLGGDELVHLGNYWLPAKSLADVHVGLLNIAEALIEMQNRPMHTSELLPEMGLPREIPQAIQAFSFDLRMTQDPRFVDVGVESREWYLRRLLPEEAVTIPRRLQLYPDKYDRSKISVPLLEIEWQLGDEWTEGGASSVTAAQLPSVSLTLTYPHRRSGTLPLNNLTRSFFPVREGKRSMITFVDGRWGKRFPGWVIPEGRYVCGLSEWYEEHKLPVGAIVSLERTDNPAEVVVDFRPHRMRREWVRMARVERQQLVFQLQKREIACDYDDTMVVAEADPEAIDELRRSLYQQNPSLDELLEELAPQLMGLSTQGSVHAKTLYSVINMVRRTTPGPIFAALSNKAQFQHLGGGMFAMSRA